jgi:phospholipase/lecithinase/hemolysin
MKRLSSLFCVAALSLICASTSFGQPLDPFQFRKLVVFGDSLSDNGNSFVQSGLPPAPYFEGRWSNGFNWVDDFPWIALNFLPATAFLKDGGTDFAVANDTSENLSTQIATFLSNSTASPDAQYVIWIGSNDFAGGINPSTTAKNIINGINQLAAAGAKDIAVLNIPDISLTPTVIARGGATISAAKNFVSTANNLLAIQVPGAASSRGINASLIDIDSLFTQLVQNPVAFGFTNSTGAAFDTITGKVQPDPNDFLFWDGFHPTKNAHFFAAEFIYLSIFEQGQIFSGLESITSLTNGVQPH